MKNQPKQSCDDAESIQSYLLILNELEHHISTNKDYHANINFLFDKAEAYFKNSNIQVLFIDDDRKLLRNDLYGLKKEEKPAYEIALNENNYFESFFIQQSDNLFISNVDEKKNENVLHDKIHLVLPEAKSLMFVHLFHEGTAIGLISVKNKEINAFTSCNFEFLQHLSFFISTLVSQLVKDKILKQHEDELIAARKQLLESEKMASLGQLSAGIAHEIKNPLNFINNFAVLSVDLSTELSEEFEKLSGQMNQNDKEYLAEIIQDLQSNMQKIKEHGQRAESIIKGMLLHSRGKTGELIPTDINALLAEYVNLGYHGMRAQDISFNIKIESSYDQTIGRIQVVPQNLSRVFLNIINNACYATNEKKTKLKEAYFPTLSVQTKNGENEIEIRIRDNGPGIPQSVIDKVFNPFFTTKPPGQGTGLGLSLSYEIIVKEHHGQMQVESQDGEYAEFIIKIPKNLT